MKRSICIIDDDDDVREILCYAMEHEGFSVLPFAEPQVALKSLLKLPLNEFPAMIIVDYLMPEMNGITLITELRRLRPEISGTPLALNSASGSVEHSRELPRDILHLTKPMELDALLEVIKRHTSVS